MLGAVEPKFWRAFCEAAGRPDWIARQTEPLPQADLISELTRYFGGLTASACEACFAASDCCVSLVLDLAEAVKTPHHARRGVVQRGPLGGLQVLFPALVDGKAQALRMDFIEVGEARWA
jgi:crotonobetainyl-CoA:carnitine CoA-transferase CaiB-like acyl-CoA transferase